MRWEVLADQEQLVPQDHVDQMVRQVQLDPGDLMVCLVQLGLADHLVRQDHKDAVDLLV